MRPLELLAPARNLECGIAAIDHGADAVYIGPERFGARAAAGNSLADIAALCRHAHQYDAKVYATVNTLLRPDELAPAEQLIHELYKVGVDAILVQDMQLLHLSLPPIALHASTQADNRTAQKVRLLREQGFRRVVLARELSAAEVSAIHEAVPDVELEVFVHGALCVSYSGQCYISEHLFGRSANRGECAQVCRMPFDLIDSDGRLLQQGRHLLSLKDLNLIDHLELLAQSGATSFKIEGRLKDVAYVKNVTAAYNQRLNQLVRRHPDRYCRASKGRCTYSFQPNLDKTFNRGFTTYFLHGRQPDIFSPDTPKAMGEFVGRVKEVRGSSFTVAGTARFANGDGLCYIYKNERARELRGFRINRAEGNRLFPQHMPSDLRPGLSLWRNQDQEFERQLARPSSQRKIPLALSLSVVPEGFRLQAGEAEATVLCPHQQAQKPQRDNIERQLARLGDTPYELESLHVPADFPYFVSNSQLAELRRSLVAALAPRTSHLDASHLAPRTSHLDASHLDVSHLDASHLDIPLMQCRHCLRYALGFCVRHGGARPQWREPLYLRLSDGHRFRLEFDCHNCQMNVLPV